MPCSGTSCRCDLNLYALDNDFGIDLFAEDSLNAVLDRHGGVGAAAAGAFESEPDLFALDRNDFKVDAVILEVNPEFFEFFSYGLFQFFHDCFPFCFWLA